MQASVIISYYKNIPNLELMLRALNRQSAIGNFEVIVSEDDDSPETISFLQTLRPSMRFPIVHLSQEDMGFRKCKALNNAVRASSTDFLVFLDGDCVPHPELVMEYIRKKAEGRVLYGRRVMLTESITQKVLSSKSFRALNLVQLVLAGCKRVEEGLYFTSIPASWKEKESGILLGCNMAMSKADLVSINGFDEDYTSPGGGEDSDLEWRLMARGGVKFFSMRFKAIVYHLYHPERFSGEMEKRNNEILNSKIAQGHFFCKNGLTKPA